MSNIKVRVKIKNIQYETERGYMIDGLWYGKSVVYELNSDYIIIPEWLAKYNGLKYTYLMNIPEHIEPEYNQEALDELRY